MKSQSVFLWELHYLVYKEFCATKLTLLSHHLREQNALWFATLCNLYSVEVCLVQVAIWAVITLPESAVYVIKPASFCFLPGEQIGIKQH